MSVSGWVVHPSADFQKTGLAIIGFWQKYTCLLEEISGIEIFMISVPVFFLFSLSLADSSA